MNQARERARTPHTFLDEAFVSEHYKPGNALHGLASRVAAWMQSLEAGFKDTDSAKTKVMFFRYVCMAESSSHAVVHQGTHIYWRSNDLTVHCIMCRALVQAFWAVTPRLAEYCKKEFEGTSKDHGLAALVGTPRVVPAKSDTTDVRDALNSAAVAVQGVLVEFQRCVAALQSRFTGLNTLRHSLGPSVVSLVESH